MPDIPTVEPTELIAGLTVKWRREDLVSDYPATTWTLTYYFVGPTMTNQAATADGSHFAVTLTADTTTGLLPGRYTLYGRVSNGSELYEVYRADLVVIEDPAAVEQAADQRSWARRCLEKLEAAIEGSADSIVLNYSIAGAGRTIGKMSPQERIDMRDYFASKVLQEDQLAGRKSGKVLIRFSGI